MNLSKFLSIGGVIGILYGLGFLLLPTLVLSQYGTPTDPQNLLEGRYFGGALLAWGLTSWFARGVRDDAALRAILIGTFAGGLTSLVVSVFAIVSGLENEMAWLSVATYALLMLGAVFFLMSPTRRTQVERGVAI